MQISPPSQKTEEQKSFDATVKSNINMHVSLSENSFIAAACTLKL